CLFLHCFHRLAPGGQRLLDRTQVTLGEHVCTRLNKVLPSGVRLLQCLVQRFGLRWSWHYCFSRDTRDSGRRMLLHRVRRGSTPEDEAPLELTPCALLVETFAFHNEIRHET